MTENNSSRLIYESNKEVCKTVGEEIHMMEIKLYQLYSRVARIESSNKKGSAGVIRKIRREIRNLSWKMELYDAMDRWSKLALMSSKHLI